MAIEKLHELAVLIVSNAANEKLLKGCFDSWSNAFIPGKSLFVSGPASLLECIGINKKCIVSYEVDVNGDYGEYFINKKKIESAKNIEASYVLIIHDRIFAAEFSYDQLFSEIVSKKADFGSIKVINRNGDLSVGPLFLKDKIINSELVDSLIETGRLVTYKETAHKKTAVNGAVFFMRKTLLDKVSTSFAWGEMEDDVMSFELQDHKGIFIDNVHLISEVYKPHPSLTPGGSFLDLKLALYYSLIVILRLFLAISFFFKNYFGPYIFLSPNSRINKERLIKSIAEGKSIIFIDPAHKRFWTSIFKLSFEKLTTIFRALKIDNKKILVKQEWYGWVVYFKSKL